ncbi:hypothetical protein FQZ97_1178640 [compost metagenome]
MVAAASGLFTIFAAAYKPYPTMPAMTAVRSVVRTIGCSLSLSLIEARNFSSSSSSLKNNLSRYFVSRLPECSSSTNTSMCSISAPVRALRTCGLCLMIRSKASRDVTTSAIGTSFLVEK